MYSRLSSWISNFIKANNPIIKAKIFAIDFGYNNYFLTFKPLSAAKLPVISQSKCLSI